MTKIRAGLYYGYDSIPREWIEALAGKAIIEDCIEGMGGYINGL